MKKLFAAVVITLALVGGVAVCRAGLPITQPFQGQGAYWDASIIGSTNPASGTPAFVVFPARTKAGTGGGSTITGRNCLTRLVLQLSYGTTAYLLDSGTTVYQILGSGIATSTTSLASGQAAIGSIGTFNLTWGELGPYCGTAGSSMTISVPIPAQNTPSNTINYEGFSMYAPSANSQQ